MKLALIIGGIYLALIVVIIVWWRISDLIWERQEAKRLSEDLEEWLKEMSK